MYFKKVELSGFKSFADRTVVPLEPGITAIVGPNGCGKSNILDGLRWALGEQSAKALRGSHMQDVIFNGSEHRPPLGLAEVTLVFDNADSRLPIDFAEVQVTRRVYRSGESEYLLNKAPCRLRDIQELFMDTGIGTNAYSLIGQGKIDMVLSSKPEDRRFLFEEAAGIIKYKTRKRVALRKLESAEQNLLRLQDIIGELDRQMRTLKRQVNAAIRHRELTTELRDLEIRAAWLQFCALDAAIRELREKLADATARYTHDAGAVAELEAQLEALNLERLEVERALLARRDGVYQIDSEMEKLERQIALLRQQAEFAAQKQTQAVQEAEAFRARAAELQGASDTIDTHADETRGELTALHKRAEEQQKAYAEQERAVALAEAEVEGIRSKALETLQTQNRTETELQTLGVGLENIDEQLKAIYGRQQEQEDRQAALTTALVETREEESSAQRNLTETANARKRAQEERKTLGEKAATATRTLQEGREALGRDEARLGSLRELRDSYEGFATGVRAVMLAHQEGQGKLRGIIGPAGDLLSTEPRYERAIEAALGGNINNIIVSDADAAKAAIHFLKETRAGRVTFLPLDTMRSGPDDGRDALKGFPGVIGPAIDHVKHEARIGPAVRFLFHSTVIVETIDDAIRIARAEARYPRLVTLDGEVVSAGGAVTGGRTRHESRGLLGRSAEIEELEGRVAKNAKRLEAVTAELAAMHARMQELRDTALALEGQEQQHREAVGAASLRVARLSTELESLQQTAAQLLQQRDKLNAEREALEARRGEAQARASAMEGDADALQAAVADAQQAASQARHQLSQLGQALSDVRVQIAELTQRLEESVRSKEREARERETVLEQAAEREALSAQMIEEMARLEEEIAQHLERGKALSETKEEASAKVTEAQRRQHGVQEKTEQIARTLKETRERSDSAQKEVHAYELDLTQKEQKVAYFQERMASEYGVALASLKAEEVGTDDYEDRARDQRINEARKELQRLGTVNLMAIEEYEQLEKRHLFLTTQAEDLGRARDTLYGVIQRIDATIRTMFMETFETISENFKQNFRRLFNGGQARIYLLDEDDPLESGVEIEARPPGKKPQSISLLSGGEQAMTAIALLFSIFAAKPSPFCVLDEVDAPLDDANIGRFLSLVGDFTNESQFVIITHNKQTMARADAIFGVTQQERGVSQLVSVRFEDETAGTAA